MASRNDPLTVVGYIEIDGELVDAMTVKDRLGPAICREMSKALSEYYRFHPDEYLKLVENQ